MFSSPRDAFGIAEKKLGYSYNTEDPEEIAAAAEELKRQKPLVQAYVADEVFDNIGVETPKRFDEAEIRGALKELDDRFTYGDILRAKGILPTNDGRWLHFDYVPGESEIRYGSADYTVIHAQGKHVYTDTGVRLAYIWYTGEGVYRDEDVQGQGALDQSFSQVLREGSLVRQIHYDTITGLPNMTLFFTLAEAARGKPEERVPQSALLYMDLNGMKY